MRDPSVVIALAGGLVAVLLLVLAVVLMNRRSVQRRSARTPVGGANPETNRDGSRPRAAVVINPTKFDDTAPLEEMLCRISREHGWAEPLILETTEEDNGTGQARDAIAEGVDVVCAFGGDGTVRAVAAALIDTDVPLGLLPGGTGNLLARNLDLPIDDPAAAFRVCLTGQDRRIDVGMLNVVVPGDTQQEAKDHCFLVMAGVGFDADVMAQAPEDLKAQMGWVAYLVSGLRNLNGHRFRITVAFDEGEPEHRRVRSVIIGNCGRLQGGVELFPDAQLDDDTLDVVLLAPRGIIGWAGVAARVLTKQRKGHHRVEHHRCRGLMVHLDEAQEVQLDGDPIGPGLVLTATVRPDVLSVRVSAESTR